MVEQHAPERDDVPSGPAAGREPHSPTELPTRSWWAVLQRTVREFGRDLTDWADSVVSIFRQ